MPLPTNERVFRILLLATIAALSLCLMLWSVHASGFMGLFRGDPPQDPAHLRGKILGLTGKDAFVPGRQVDLDDFRGQPLLLVRAEKRYTHWLIGALKRWQKNETRKIAMLAVFTANDEDPPTWVLDSGLPFRGVVIDSETMQNWGFVWQRAELRLIDADGRVATVDLAGDDRDDTIVQLNHALEVAGITAGR